MKTPTDYSLDIVPFYTRGMRHGVLPDPIRTKWIYNILSHTLVHLLHGKHDIEGLVQKKDVTP